MKSAFTLIVDIATLYDASGRLTYEAKNELVKLKPMCNLCVLCEKAEDFAENSQL